MNLFTEFLRYLVDLFDVVKLATFLGWLLLFTVGFTTLANRADRRKKRPKI